MSTHQVTSSGLEERSLTEILAPGAIEFVAELHRTFAPRREELLAARRARHETLRAGGTLDFAPGCSRSARSMLVVEAGVSSQLQCHYCGPQTRGLEAAEPARRSTVSD